MQRITRGDRGRPGRRKVTQATAVRRTPRKRHPPSEGYVSETLLLRPGHSYTIGQVIITPTGLAPVRLLYPRATPIVDELLARTPIRRKAESLTPVPSPAMGRGGNRRPLRGQLPLF